MAEAHSDPRLRVVLIEDENDLREGLELALELAGFAVVSFADGESALVTLDTEDVDAVVTDLRLPGMDGLAVLEHCRRHHPTRQVVLMTGHGDVRTAVAAMRGGAFDFIEKPFGRDRLISITSAAGERSRQLRGGMTLAAAVRGGADRSRTTYC